jgi:hypothetical protein
MMATACTDEDITGTGRELVAGGVVRTSEIVLTADAFLASDSTLTGFSELASAVTLLARDVAGGLEARGAFRFAAAPIAIDVATDSTTFVTDTLATIVGARLEFVIDTLTAASADTVRLAVGAIQEPWDPATATWENRVDSAFAVTPWSAPGGGAIVPVDSAVWSVGTDSISFSVDSATAVAWTDTDDDGRGVLVTAASDGARLEMVNAILWAFTVIAARNGSRNRVQSAKAFFPTSRNSGRTPLSRRVMPRFGRFIPASVWCSVVMAARSQKCCFLSNSESADEMAPGNNT